MESSDSSLHPVQRLQQKHVLRPNREKIAVISPCGERAEPYTVAFAAETSEPKVVESEAHAMLAEHRTNKKREFFRVSVDDARRCIERIISVRSAALRR